MVQQYVITHTSFTQLNYIDKVGVDSITMVQQYVITHTNFTRLYYIDKVPCAIGGGVDSITLVQPKDFNPKAGVVEKV